MRAYQLDANTIIGIADPADIDGDGVAEGAACRKIDSKQSIFEEGENGATGIPVFVLHLDPQIG